MESQGKFRFFLIAVDFFRHKAFGCKEFGQKRQKKERKKLDKLPS